MIMDEKERAMRDANIKRGAIFIVLLLISVFFIGGCVL